MCLSRNGRKTGFADWIGAPRSSGNGVHVPPHQPCILHQVAGSRPAERALGPKLSNELRLEAGLFSAWETRAVPESLEPLLREIKNFVRESIK